MNSQINENVCRNAQFTANANTTPIHKKNSFEKHLIALDKAARMHLIREERKKEAKEIAVKSRLRPSSMKYWWNDPNISHVTQFERREQKHADKKMTLDRKTDRQIKFDNAQSPPENGEFGELLPVRISPQEFEIRGVLRNIIRNRIRRNIRALRQSRSELCPVCLVQTCGCGQIHECFSCSQKGYSVDGDKIHIILKNFRQDNAQGVLDTKITIPGIDLLTEAIEGFKIPTNLNVSFPDMETIKSCITDLRNVAGETTSLLRNPVAVEHRFGAVLDPVVQVLKTIRDIGWKGILVDFLFYLVQCYNSGWKRATILTGLANFIWSQRHFFDEMFMVYDLMNVTQIMIPVENAQSSESLGWIGGLVSSLCVVLAALGLGKLPGGKTTNDLFNRLSRIGACMTSIKMLKEFFSESIVDILDYFRVNWFGYTSSKLNEWKSYDDFCAEVEKLHNTDFERDVPGNGILKNHIDSLIVKGDTILKEIEKLKIPQIQTVRFRSHYMFLERLRSLVAVGGGGMHAPRIPAQIIQFYGETGVGKSELTSMLNACLLASQGFKDLNDFHRLIYYRDSSQERFDGFISQVQGVVIDDYGSRFDSTTNPNPEPLEIIRMSNGAVWKLDMPNLSEKGNTFFSAKWVILTSNAANHKWDSLTNPEAVARRIALKFRQYPHPSFAKVELINNKHVVTLDVEKVEEVVRNDPTAYSQVWLFDLVDGKNKSAEPRVLRSKLTFGEVADMCVELVRISQDRGTRRIAGTNNMFLKYVEKYCNAEAVQHREEEASCANGCENNVWCTHTTNSDEELRRRVTELRKEVDFRQAQDAKHTELSELARQNTDAELEQIFHNFERMAESSLEAELEEDSDGQEDNAQMMEETSEKEAMRDVTEQTGRVVERTRTVDSMRKLIEKTRDPKVGYITAGSKAEMLAKTSAWCDYAFGSGGDPNRNSRGHRNYTSEHTPNPNVSLNEFLPREKPSFTFIETLTGKTHIDLAALLALNPDYVDKSFLGNINSMNLTGMPTNYCELLGSTCVIIPEKIMELFTRAYSTAINIFLTSSGAGRVEKMYLFKFLPESDMMLFNQVMHHFLSGRSLKELGIEPCPEHDDRVKMMSSVYAFMTKSFDYVKKYYQRASLWASWIKTEVIFTGIRAVAIVASTIVVTTVWKWLTGTSPKKVKKPKNAESAQDKTKGATSSTNLESFQNVNKGVTPTNLESFQEQNKARPNTNVENAEAVSDQNANEIQTKLMGNLFGVMNADKGISLGSILFLRGRMAVTNRHIAMVLREKIILSNSNESFTVRADGITVTTVPSSSPHADKDLVLLEFPRHIRVFADVTKYFMTREDFRMHTSLTKVSLVSHKENRTVRYGNLCRATDRPFELIAGGQSSMIREAYEYNIETVKGDCGSVLVALDKNFERKIIGIHMAAGVGAYLGVSVAIHSDFLSELIAVHRCKYPESMVNGQCNIPTDHDDEKSFEGNYLPLGKVETIYQPLKTNIHPSPLHGVIATPLTAPAKLSRFTEDGVVIDPFVNARKKALTESVEVDEEILDRSINHYATKFLENIDEDDRKILTIDEAIQGIENEPTYLPIKRNTSPGGLPSFHGWTKTGKGKRSYLDNGDGTYRTDHPLVLEKVNLMLEKVKNGQRSDTVWIDTLKDERRTIEKVKAGKTRLFAAGEMAYLILFRMYFFGFASHMMKNRIVNESCVGINVYSQEWTILANRMRSKGKHIIAGDFTNYDGTLSATILWRLLDLIEMFYEGNDEEKMIRRMLWLDIVNSVHVSGNKLYVWSHSQPSGCPITALLNSLYHSISARYVYIVCARKYSPELVSLTNFDRLIAHNNYGDDDLWNISEEIVSWFNQDTISEAYTTIGMTYTDELKTGRTVPTRTLDEVQFLKRKFRFDVNQSRFRCPLSLDTILEMAMWNHGTKNIIEITGDTLQEAVYELSHHDEAVFSENMPRFEKAQRIIPVPLGTYSEYQETEYYRYCC